MNLPKSLTRLCVAAAVLGAAARAGAQEEGAPRIPKPTVEHKILAADEGTWDATIKAFMAGPDAEPTISKGVEVNTMLPGGLWLLSEFRGDIGGMAVEGRGHFGYDPLKKEYVGTWIDSMSPALSVLEGTYDAKTRTMTYEGEGVDPDTEAEYTQRMVTTSNDDGTRVFTLYMKFEEADDEIKFMEVTYTKRK